MYSFSVIGIRLLAFYFILSGLASLGYVLAPLFEDQANFEESYFYYSLWVLSSLVFGVLIFLLARPFSGIIVHALPKTEIKKADVDIVTVGTFLIGLFFVGDNLPYAINQTFFPTGGQTFSTGDLVAQAIFSTWVPVILGAIIMIVSSPMAKIFSKLRKL